MAITFNGETKKFYLDGKSTTYAFFVNKVGCLEHLYYGNAISHDDITYTRAWEAGSCLATAPGIDTMPENHRSYIDFPPELAFFGTGDYREPAVLVENPSETD